MEVIIKKILVEELFVEVKESDIDIKDGLQSVLGLDSLGFIELRVQCENLFNVHISDKDYNSENFSNIESIMNLIKKLQKDEK